MVQSKAQEKEGAIMKMCMTNISSLTTTPLTEEDFHGMAVMIIKQCPDDFRTLVSLVKKFTEVEGGEAQNHMET